MGHWLLEVWCLSLTKWTSEIDYSGDKYITNSGRHCD